MREDWNIKKLSEVCQIKPPKKEAKETLSESDLVSFVPMKILGIDEKFFVPEENKELSKVSGSYTYFRDGDVLLAKITPCFENGKLGIAKEMENGVGFGSSEFVVFRANEELFNEFLYYFLSQEYFREIGKGQMTGAVGHKRIPKEFYENYELPIPPLQEQKQIVNILDEAFAAIDQAKANLEKNIENAKELFQSKLNEICTYKEESWEISTMGEVCDLFQGLAINAKTKHLLVDNSSLPLLRIKDLKNETEEQYVSEEGYPEKSFVEEDELIYTRTGSLGLVFRGRRGILHNNAFKVTPNEKIEKNYLFWWMQHLSFNKIIVGLASRAAQPDITHKLFKAQEIIIPPISYQENEYERIEQLNQEVAYMVDSYQAKLNNLDDLKKSILQKAFSGELTQKTVEA